MKGRLEVGQRVHVPYSNRFGEEVIAVTERGTYIGRTHNGLVIHNSIWYVLFHPPMSEEDWDGFHDHSG
jgi:hypothetical protein